MQDKRPSARKTRGIFLPKNPLDQSVPLYPKGLRPKAVSSLGGLFILGILLIAQPAMAQSPQPAIWKVLMAEAVSEGYDGMYAVACVIRNRGGDLSGFMGAKRPDLGDFVKKQGQRYIRMAKEIQEKVFERNGPDITKGATHFENIGSFAMPYWAKSMIVTVKIGDHTFFKEVR